MIFFMKVWSLSDLHLCISTPDKTMEVFGEPWVNYLEKIFTWWHRFIDPEDLVLIAGDISWAKNLQDAKIDLQWIHQLPGTKFLIKGNHDLWFHAISKVRQILPPSIKAIYLDAVNLPQLSIGGSRMWEDPSIDFSHFVEMRKVEGVHIRKKPDSLREKLNDKKIFQAELQRLEMSLKQMEKTIRICMLHYPPTGPDQQETEITKLLEDYHVTHVVYGHLHNLHPAAPVNFTKNGIQYIFTAADYLRMEPIEILSL